MRVYISPVGDRDPRPRDNPDSLGAAVSIALEVCPDVVFLMPSRDRPGVRRHTMRQAEETQVELHNLFPAATIHTCPYEVDDASDDAQVMEETGRLLRSIQAAMKDSGPEYFANVSSGTPQMHASLRMAIAVGLIPAVALQSRDPAQITDGGPQVREVATRRWLEAMAADRAWRQFKLNQFAACEQDIAVLCDTPDKRKRAAGVHFRDLARFYAAVHQINYSAASKLAGSQLSPIRGEKAYSSASDTLGDQIAILGRLASPPKTGPVPARETPEFLADIFHNARRCHEMHAYADCLARVWRVLEGTQFLRLRERFGIEPSDVASSQNRELAEKIIASSFPRAPRDSIRLSLGQVEHLIEHRVIEDTEYVVFGESSVEGLGGKARDAADRLRGNRNNSVVGHGRRPVTAQEARDGLRLAQAALERLVPGIDLDGHPFAPGPIARVGKVFFDALRT